MPGYLHPDAQASIDAANQRNAERLNGLRPYIDPALTARSIGDMALLEPGCEIWAHTSDDDPAPAAVDLLMRVDGEPIGGLILEVTSKVVHHDPVTGEIVHRRAFRCFDFTMAVGDRHSVQLLTENQVALAKCKPVDLRVVRRQMRRVAKWVGEQSGTASTVELDHVAHIQKLAAIVKLRDRLR